MKIPAEFAKEVARFPDALRGLIEAELEAGNEITELAGGFPAPPVGAYVKLSKPVTTRPRESAGDVDFFDRNGSDYSGEFTDAKRHFFVLEPPHPPEPEPDMDAIRAALKARQTDALTEMRSRTPSAPKRRKKSSVAAAEAVSESPAPRKEPETAVDRFRESMVMDFEKWHDGIGYDLAILKTASPDELVEIENVLVSRGIRDWRDVEALAALDSPRARVLLKAALKSSNPEISTAVINHAPGLVSEDERTSSLVAALEVAESFGGLAQTLLEVEEFHPSAVIEALLRGVLARGDGVPVHFAAMLMFLHGKAESAFDWAHRPFFLKFHTEDRAERESLFRELCEKIGVKPGKFLRRKAR
jgi:hypothetical protein